MPNRLFLPLAQHIGLPGEAIVRIGERVLKGQLLAQAAGYVSAPVHAPTSGQVLGLVAGPIVHPGGLSAPGILLEPDGRDQWVARIRHDDYGSVEPAVIQELIRRRGIVGFGGAGFPTHVKIREALNIGVEILIINGAECEPYISCDSRLLQERPDEVVTGALVLRHAVQAKRCVLAIEDDMPATRAAMQTRCEGSGIEIVSVPEVYPTGGEKQLIRVLTGREVPSGGLPAHVGVMVQNVATAAAVYRAVCCGEPAVSRIVTVAGDIPEPGNFEALLGTPIRVLLEQAGYRSGGGLRVISGGPMMGIAVADLEAPVTKVTNCVLLQTSAPVPRPRPCIRCGACDAVCPVGLQAEALYRLTNALDLDGAQDYHLFDCIECGCCAYVCPSRIPLVQHYRYAKSMVEGLDRAHARAEAARAGYAQHRQGLAADTVPPDLLDAPASRADIRAEIAAAVERAGRRP